MVTSMRIRSTFLNSMVTAEESNPVIGIVDMAENNEIVAEFLLYVFGS